MKLLLTLFILLLLTLFILLLPSCALYKLNEQTRPHFETAKQKADREAAEVARYLNHE